MCRLAGVLPSGSPWSARRALAEHGLALRAPVVGNAEADLPRGVHVDLEVAVTHHLDVDQQPARLDDHGAHTLGTSKEFVQAAARALDTGAECLQDRGALALVQVAVVVLLRVVPLLVVVPIVRHHSRLAPRPVVNRRDETRQWCRSWRTACRFEGAPLRPEQPRGAHLEPSGVGPSGTMDWPPPSGRRK